MFFGAAIMQSKVFIHALRYGIIFIIFVKSGRYQDGVMNVYMEGKYYESRSSFRQAPIECNHNAKLHCFSNNSGTQLSGGGFETK